MRWIQTLLVCSLTGAQNMDSWTGHWEGAVESPRQSYPVEIDLVKNAKGELAGTQGAFPLKLEFKNHILRFASRNDQVFWGELSKDGKTISGDHEIMGYRLPFKLVRTAVASTLSHFSTQVHQAIPRLK